MRRLLLTAMEKPSCNIDYKPSWIDRCLNTTTWLMYRCMDVCGCDPNPVLRPLGPRYTFHRDDYFFHNGKEPAWRSFGARQVADARQDIVRHIDRLREEGIPVVWTPSLLRPPYQTQDIGKVKRGIIYSGADGKILQRLRLSLHMLRDILGSKLPVEIYHFPHELQDEKTRAGLMEDFGDGVELKVVHGAHGDGKNYREHAQADYSLIRRHQESRLRQYRVHRVHLARLRQHSSCRPRDLV